MRPCGVRAATTPMSITPLVGLPEVVNKLAPQMGWCPGRRNARALHGPLRLPLGVVARLREVCLEALS